MNASERQFFSTVKRAVTVNPFGEERLAVDLELADASPAHSRDDVLKRLVSRVARAIEKVAQEKGKDRVSSSKEEGDLLRYAFLFLIFHRYCDQYDQLIEHQMQQGDTPCKVVFAEDILRELMGFGFNRSDALRFFSLFFQMRRAFYFIRSIAGESSCVQELRKRLWNNIFTHNIELYEKHLWNRMEDFSTMLLGETGTGKGLAASAIGRSGFIPYDAKRGCFSESFAQAFVSINLSQFPEQLIESELFGHRKGAFTGAVEAHKGIFSRCSPHGAIFLDEIGDVSGPVQIKLLQVLQERVFSPVGSHSPERFQGRVIAATNRPLAAMRKDGRFREDFYYRLCSDVIEVPSLQKRLRQHPGEIRVILSFIIKRIVGKPSSELVDEISLFIRTNQPQGYSWPGNIRELEQCVRQILLHRQYDWQVTQEVDPLSVAVEQGELTAGELLAAYCRKLHKRHQTYEAVGRVTGLDRRTVKKYITSSG